MITDKDTQIARYKDRVKDFERKPEYSIKLVSARNYRDFEKDLRTVIDYLKKDLPDWKESPHFGDCEHRFIFHSRCFLFYYQEKPIGWYWYNDDVRFDFIDIEQRLPKGVCYGGGAFVTNQVERPKGAGRYMYQIVSDFLFTQLGYNKMVAYVNGWNVKGIMTSLRTGAGVENWYDSWNLE